MTADKEKPGGAGTQPGNGGLVAGDDSRDHPHYIASTAESQERAAAALRGLLRGDSPNGTDPATLGVWADAWRSLAKVPDLPNRRKIFDALARDDPGLTRLVAGDPQSQLSGHNVTPETVLSALGRGETGDAELLEALYAGLIVYDHAASGWYLWGGHSWQPDRTGAVYRLVSNQVAANYLTRAASERAESNDELAKKLADRAGALRNRKRVENVLFLAARQPKLAITGQEWDRNPWLLGVQNGVLDLQSGQLNPGWPDDYVRSVAPTAWEGSDAPAPRWAQFIAEVFGEDAGLVSFLQALLGYGLTGLTREHVLPILFGGGRNGKGTLLETLGDVLGQDLAISSQADALMDVRQGGGDGPQPFVFALRGKRLVWASESSEGRRINAGLIKQLTGGDRLNVRTLHGKPVEFKPSHLLLLLTNHKPHISADDQSMWDRVLLIPFTRRFVDNPAPGEYKRDPALREKLLAEAPGILAWLVRGCLEWQRDGLNPPPTVQAATVAYREEEDEIGLFIGECCVIGDKCEVRAGDLFAEYSRWAKVGNLKGMTQTAFGTRIKKRYASSNTTGYVIYKGLGLLAPAKETETV
jgi:putative DNA primase/helicase